MKRLIQWAIRKKVVLDLGLWALQPLQYGMLCIICGKSIADWMGWKGKVVAAIIAASSFVIMCIIGVTMDQVGAMQVMNEEYNKRNALLTRLDQKDK